MRDLIDKKFDLMQSLPKMYVFLMLYALTIIFWVAGANTIKTLPEPSERLFGILGLMLLTIKFVQWIGKPNLVYRTRTTINRGYNRSETENDESRI